MSGGRDAGRAMQGDAGVVVADRGPPHPCGCPCARGSSRLRPRLPRPGRAGAIAGGAYRGGASGTPRKWASPSDPNARPPAASAVSPRPGSRSRGRSVNAASPSAWSRRVEPSMSVNRKVTVPTARRRSTRRERLAHAAGSAADIGRTRPSPSSRMCGRSLLGSLGGPRRRRGRGQWRAGRSGSKGATISPVRGVEAGAGSRRSRRATAPEIRAACWGDRRPRRPAVASPSRATLIPDRSSTSANRSRASRSASAAAASPAWAESWAQSVYTAQAARSSAIPRFRKCCRRPFRAASRPGSRSWRR